MRNICCDPFQRHKQVARKNVESVSEALVNLVNDESIHNGVFVCCSCRIKLRRESAGSQISQDEPNDVSDEASSPARPVVASATSTPSPFVRLDAEAVVPSV